MPPGRGNPLRNVQFSYAELPTTTAGTHRSAHSLAGELRRLLRPSLRPVAQAFGLNVANAVLRSVSHSVSLHSLALQLTMIE